jgi:hypothetical protein
MYFQELDSMRQIYLNSFLPVKDEQVSGLTSPGQWNKKEQGNASTVHFH